MAGFQIVLCPVRCLMLLVTIAAALHIGGCVETSPDPQGTMPFNDSQPFHLEFGRGSGWHGLDTIVMDQTGTVVMHRQQWRTFTKNGVEINENHWETAALTLPTSAVQQVLAAIEDCDLLSMHKNYYDPNIVDGTQWDFWLTQGNHEKSIYFNNAFPDAITRFANSLDEILAANGLKQAHWVDCPTGGGRNHEDPLWRSTER